MSGVLLIEPLHLEHVSAVAEIHMNELEIGLLSKLGIGYLKNVFYPTIAGSKLIDAYVLIEQETHQVLGVIVYLKRKSIWECFPIKISFLTVAYLLKSLLKTPRLILDMLSICLSKEQFKASEENIEIFIFAVKKENQGKGLGSYLLNKTLNLYQNVYKGVVVQTHTHSASQFYQNHSFEVVAQKVNRGRYFVDILQKKI